MATYSGNGTTSYSGCIAYGPFEVMTLRAFAIDKTVTRRPVEVLRKADRHQDAIVRYIGAETAFGVAETRLEPLA